MAELTDLKLHRDLGRGARAEALLENDLLKEAFDGLEQEYMAHWRDKTALNDTAGRERLWQAIHIVGKVRKHLEIIAADGRVAKAEIDALAQGGK